MSSFFSRGGTNPAAVDAIAPSRWEQDPPSPPVPFEPVGDPPDQQPADAPPEFDGAAAAAASTGVDDGADGLEAVDDDRIRVAMALANAVGNLRQQALFNFGDMTGVKLTAVIEQMLEHSELHASYLETVRAVFAPPPGYQDAYTAFEKPGTVLVLLRDPGAGRTFAAHALLADLRHRTGASVGPLSFGSTSRFPVLRLPRVENVGYLLELPADEDTFAVDADFGAQIDRLQHALRKRSSRLIVLTTPQQWARISAGAPPDIVAGLGLPDPVAVARAWLQAEDDSLDAETWLADPRIQHLLARQGPSDVLQIVSLILNAERRSASEDLDPSKRDQERDERVRSVVAARTNWRKDLLDWHCRAGRTSFQRNFLLVASLLREAPVAHVYAQTSELNTCLGDQAVSLSGQQAPGVIEMVHAIEGDLSEDDTVQFTRPGWDDAALAYFWIDRPISRKKFLAWMAKAPTIRTSQYLETISPEDRKLLAQRVGAFAVRWAARQGKADPLEEIVTAWHNDDTVWPIAVELVSAAALHPTLARFIHDMLLRWSKKDSVPLQRLTVDVCAGEFGRRHTGKALLRLLYAAASPNSDVHTALRKAVRNLWKDPTARPNLFAEVISWCSPDSRRIAAGRRAFSALATLTDDDRQDWPLLLRPTRTDSDFDASSAALSTGWRALLDSQADEAEAAEALRLWMDTALLHPETQPTVFSVLRQGVDVPGRAGGDHPRHRLRDLLYQWQPVPAEDADPERVRLRHALADEIAHDHSRSLEKYRPSPAGPHTVPV